MDQKLTAQLQKWLGTPSEKRDVQAGRLLVLQLTHNTILADNFNRAPKRYMSHVEYQLSKFLNVRIALKEHSDVQNMMASEQKVAKELHLDPPMKGPITKARAEKSEIDRGRGKRPDHDQLPPEIQAKWVENAELKRRIIKAHAQLCILSETKNGTVCPDGDRFPFVQEVLECSALLHKNYKEYDEYVL